MRVKREESLCEVSQKGEKLQAWAPHGTKEEYHRCPGGSHATPNYMPR